MLSSIEAKVGSGARISREEAAYLFEEASDEALMRLGSQVRARFHEGRDATYLVNCGAVGQPRDGDPRAAFGVLDTESRTLTVVRVTYDVATAQAKIIAAGLPEVLAQRLAIGR